LPKRRRASDSPFDLVVTAEDAKDYKPAPVHFRRFFRVSGVDLDGWVHVACSFFHDVGPAKELGVKRIWVDRDQTGEDPAWATARLPDARGLAATVEGLF
jgi:Predicted hydrolase (HAD superfamily)